MRKLSIAATMAARRASELREDGGSDEMFEEEVDAVGKVGVVRLVERGVGVDGVVLVT